MIFKSFAYRNWKGNEPANVLQYLFSPAPLGLRLMNFFCQKILRINAEVPFMVHFTSTVSKTITLGKNVAASFANSGGCYVQGINGVIIGDDTIFAPGVRIISANHMKDSYDKHDKTIGPVVIGKRCWIGVNAVILPGVRLGDNVIVGAGSVVTKSFGDNVIVAGNPAKIIKRSEEVSTQVP